MDTVTITSLKSLFGNYSSFASGEIRVTVTCRELYGYGGRYYSAVTASNVVGNAAGRPTINPNGNGILSDYSFTITVPENSTVYYQIYYTTAVTSDQYPTNETGVKYDGTAVKLEAGHAAYTVIAVAYPNLSLIHIYLKTSIYNNAASREQRKMNERERMKTLKTGTQNIAYSARRRAGSTVLVYKAENKPWSEASVAPYLGRVNLEKMCIRDS